MKFKSISAALLFAAIQTLSHAAPAAQAAPTGAVTGDPTGLVGKTVMLPALPKNSDSNLRTYGNDYYACGGSMVGDAKSDISISVLRKGIKDTCGTSSGKKIVALTRHLNGNKSLEFLDAMEFTVPKTHDLVTSDCTGASMAVSKVERNSARWTSHLQAWDIVNFKFVPVANLKAVNCENIGYGL